MNIILKFFIIFIILVIFIFFIEFLKLSLKIHNMIHHIDKDKCFKIMCEIDNICKKLECIQFSELLISFNS